MLHVANVSHKWNIHEKQLQIALMQFILPTDGKKLYTEVKLKEAEHPGFINDESPSSRLMRKKATKTVGKSLCVLYV